MRSFQSIQTKVTGGRINKIDFMSEGVETCNTMPKLCKNDIAVAISGGNPTPIFDVLQQVSKVFVQK